MLNYYKNLRMPAALLLLFLATFSFAATNNLETISVTASTVSYSGCPGDTIDVTGILVNTDCGAFYDVTWTSEPSGSITNLFPASSLSPRIVIRNGVSIYKLKVTENCTQTADSVEITVIPTVVAFTGGNTGICVDDTKMLGGAPDAGIDYSWSPASGLSATNVANPTVTFPGNFALPLLTYTLTADNGTGCVVEEAINVSFYQLPEPDFAADTVCSGSATNFTNETNNPASMSDYLWEFGQGVAFSSEENPTFTYAQGGEYTVDLTATSLNGCLAKATKNIIVPSSPQIVGVIKSDPTDCSAANGRIIITAQVDFISPEGIEYSIDGGTTWNVSRIFNGLSEGNYAVRVRNGAACMAVGNTVTLTEPPAPQILSAEKTNPSDCSMQDGIIMISATGGTGTLQYSIDGVNWGSTSNFQNLGSGSYPILVRNSDGTCRVSDGLLVLSEPAAPIITEIEREHTSNCLAGDGKITITSMSGALAHQYSINGGGAWFPTNEFDNLIASTYQIRVRNADGTCEVTGGGADINDPAKPIENDVILRNPSDCASNDGRIEIDATPGVGLPQYSIDGGATWVTNNLFINMPAGSYDIALRNADETCLVNGSNVLLTDPQDIVMDLPLSTNPTDCDSNDGTITLNARSGGAVVYSIDGGMTWTTDGDFAGLSPKTYDLRVRNFDETCEQDLGSLVLTAPAAPVNVTFGATDPNLCNGLNGVIQFNGNGGNFQYSINDGTNWQAAELFPNLPKGDYQLQVRNADATCETFIDNVELIAPPTILIQNVLTENVSDCGVTDGSISIVTEYDGTAALEYSIDGGDNWSGDFIYENLPAGDYQIIVRATDATCRVIGPAEQIAAPAQPTVEQVLSSEISDCNAADGTIFIIENNANPFEISIDNGLTFDTKTIYNNLDTGSYIVRVRNTDGSCESTVGAVILAQATAPEIVDIAETHPTVCGAADGTLTITANITSGVEYSLDRINWSSQNTFENLPQGDYLPTVRLSGGGCQEGLINPVSLRAPQNGMTISPFVAQSSCDGTVGGSIQVNVTGQLGLVDYSIDGGATWSVSNQFDDLAAGNYLPAARENGSCITFGPTVSVDFAPSSLTITDYTNQAPSHCLSADGSITITPSETLAGTSFSIDGGLTWQASPTFNALTGGSYWLMIRNAEGCISTGEVVHLLAPGTPIITELDRIDGSCGTGGIIEVSSYTPSGETEYSLDNGASWGTAAVLSDVAVGTYMVRVRDLNSQCESFGGSLSISTTTAPEIDTIYRQNPECNINTGRIEISLTNALPGETEYSFNGGFLWVKENYIEDLFQGTYSVAARNRQNGVWCTTAVETVELTKKDVPTFSVSIANPSDCGIDDGRITVNATGSDTLEYSIDGMVWSRSNVLDGLASGVYTPQIRYSDETCVNNLPSVTLIAPTAPAVDRVEKTDLNCLGNGGSITIFAQAGSMDLLYSIDNGQEWFSDSVFMDLPQGDYDVLIANDNERCQVSGGQITLDLQNMPLLERIDPIPSSCFGSDGQITVTGSLGTESLSLLEYSVDSGRTWQSDAVFPGLASGVYRIALRRSDDNLCGTAPQGYFLGEMESPEILLVETTNITDCDADNGRIQIFATGRNDDPDSGIEYSLNGTDWSRSAIFENLIEGDYVPQTRFLDGTCAVIDATVTITAPASPERTSIVVTEPDCNTANGQIVIVADGASTTTNGTIQYSLNGDDWFNSGEFTNLAANTYAVLFRYSNGSCIITDTTINLASRNLPEIMEITTEPATACGESDGRISVTPEATGPSSPGIQYSLNGGVYQNSNVFTNLASGDYGISVRFNDGTCQMPPVIATVSLVETVEITEVVPTNITNCGLEDGRIFINATGTSEIEYSLDGLVFQALPNFSNLPVGTYTPTVRLKDFNCSDNDAAVLLEAPAPIFIESVSATAATDCDVNDGSISVQMLAGSGAVEYSIDNWATSSMTNLVQNLTAGSYEVSVRKLDGTCVTPYFDNPVVVETPEAPLVTVDAADPDCFRDNGILTANATPANNPANLPLEYSLDGSTWEVNNVFDSMGEGAYTVNVRLQNSACLTQVNENLARPANCGDCDDMIREDILEINLSMTPNPICIPMDASDLANHTITLDGLPVMPEGGCEADSIYYYGYAPLVILGGTDGPFELRSWTYNGTTYSGNFSNLDDVAAALSNWDTDYDWSNDTDNLSISGGGIGNSYGDMVLYSIPLDRSFNLMTNSFAQFNSFNLTIEEGGLHEFIATDNTTNCSDTLSIFITPVPPPCDDPVFTQSDYMLTATNDTAQFCLPIELLDFNNYNVILDGAPFTGATRPCQFDSVWTYLYFSFPGMGNDGPYNVNWNFDGRDTVGAVQDLDELMIMMNAFDPAGEWEVFPSIFSLIGKRNMGAAGDLTLTQVNTGLDRTESASGSMIAQGTEIEIVGTGVHQLMVENIALGCSESVTVTVVNEPTTETLLFTTAQATAIPTECLPTDELPGTLVSISVCNAPTNGVLNTGNAPCFDYTPNAGFVGTDVFCLVICDDSAPVVCDTTFVEIEVEADTNCKVFNGMTADLEMTTCNASGQVCLPVLPAALTDYTLFINGAEYTDALIACDIQTVWSYNLAVLPQGVFNLDSWTANGTTFSGSFADARQLADSMNVWDATGDWDLDNFTISGGSSSGMYSDLILSSSLGVLTVSVDSDPQPQGVEITLDFGASRIIAISSDGCQDTLDVNITCPVINDISNDITMQVGESMTFCLSDLNLPLDLSYINSVTNNCTEDNADFEYDETTNCLTISGLQAGLDTACYEICLENGTCFNWNVNVEINADCTDFFPQDNVIVGVTCDTQDDIYVCLRGFAEEISAGTYSLEIDGTPYIGDLEPCGFDSTFSINYSTLAGGGDDGPYEITEWIINGETFTGEFVDADALIDSMNTWDPTGNWVHSNFGTVIQGGNSRNTYGTMSVEQVITTSPPAVLDFNTLIVPKGYGFFVPALGSYELTFIRNVGNCTDTVMMTTACLTTENIEVTITEGDFGDFCLPTNELPGSFTETFNLCSDESGDFVEFMWSAADSCFTYEGIAPGTDRACFIACDEFGVCDTTYYTVNVLEMIDTSELIANSDSMNITFGETTILNPAGNDIFGGAIDSISIINQPSNGIATVLQDGTIEYTPEPDFCGASDMFEYEICAGGQCDTALIIITVSCDGLNFFNGFSPNGDGINDTFIIGGIIKFPNNNLKIYNRWGNLVYNQNSYTNDWEGDFDGLPLPDGTYFYLLDSGEGENFSGYLQIQR